MSRTRILLLAMAFLFTIQFFFTGAFYARLPETIPTHWNFRGEPDAYGPRSTVWIMPVLSLPLTFLFLILAWAKGKTEKERFAFLFMGGATLLFFVFVQIIVVASCLGYPVDMSRWIGAAIGLLFSMIGLGMRDLPRNNLAGIRLPWTMASDEAWDIAHKRAARIMVAGGLAGALVSLGFAGPAGVFVSAGSMLWLIVDSYIATRPARSK